MGIAGKPISIKYRVRGILVKYLKDERAVVAETQSKTWNRVRGDVGGNTIEWISKIIRKWYTKQLWWG